MKKIYIIYTLVIILMTGCSVNTKNISPSNELFTKKKECSELQNKIENKIKINFNDNDRSAWLGEMFYSPKRNTCMYTMAISTKIEDGILEHIELFDAFTNEKIEAETGCLPENFCNKSLSSSESAFRNTIRTYK